MTQPLRIALAQLNLLVGDVPGNTARMVAAVAEARSELNADLVVFQELALCGYPPEDLLFHSAMSQRVADAIAELQAATNGIAALVGYPEYADGKIYNSAVWLEGGQVKANYRKRCLPNYGVFDERRYFTAGNDALVMKLKDVPIGITICEDIWESPDAALAAVDEGAQLIVSVNGSPFRYNKQKIREKLLATRCAETGVPIIYQNMVGGQDELVFDGGSCVVNAEGETCLRAPAFDEGLYVAEFSVGSGNSIEPQQGLITPLPEAVPNIYKAIVRGVRDYVIKNGFDGVVLGLSGGIDSALCLTIAVDALGADAVQAIMMPYHYTSDISMEDAQQQAATLDVEYKVLPI